MGRKVSTMLGDFDVEEMEAGTALIERDTTKPERSLLSKVAKKVFRFEEAAWKDLYKKEVAAHNETKKAGGQEVTLTQLKKLQEEINALTGENQKLRLQADEQDHAGLVTKMTRLEEEYGKLSNELTLGPKKAFAAAWAAAENELVFGQDIKDEDPTFSSLITADLDLEMGEVASAEFKDGIRMLVQPTPWGNVVAYQDFVTHTFHGEKVAVEVIRITASDTVQKALPLEEAVYGGASSKLIELVFTKVNGDTWGTQMADHLTSEIALAARLEKLVGKEK